RQSDGYLFGYHLDYNTSGAWTLSAASQVIASGVTAPPGLNSWHNLAMIFNGGSIGVVIDGSSVASIFDQTFTSGLGGLGSSWNNVQFDDFVIDVPPGSVPVIVTPPMAILGASESEQFHSSVTGGSGQVNWSVSPNLGTITTAGLYTAPSYIGSTEVVTVTA